MFLYASWFRCRGAPSFALLGTTLGQDHMVWMKQSAMSKANFTPSSIIVMSHPHHHFQVVPALAPVVHHFSNYPVPRSPVGAQSKWLGFVYTDNCILLCHMWNLLAIDHLGGSPYVRTRLVSRWSSEIVTSAQSIHIGSLHWCAKGRGRHYMYLKHGLAFL